MTAITIDHDTITIPAAEQYSDAWCACLEGLLTECGMWPIEYTDGQPYHWCPECYRDRVIDAYEDLLYDHEPGDPEPTLEDARRNVFSLWEARVSGSTCDGGHDAPRIEW